MGVFDIRRKRRLPKGDSGNASLEEIQDLRAEVPDINTELADLDRAISQAEKQWNKRCQCWE